MDFLIQANDFHRTRVKICGFTRNADCLFAAKLGIDAVGLVFYAKSPRAVSIDQARQVVLGLPPFVSVVALFVDEEPETVRAVIEQVPVSLLQFHGEEGPDYCEAFSLPYIKAIRMHERVDLDAVQTRHAHARALLLDAWHPEQQGGTGQKFDWNRIPPKLHMPIILAGGLNPDNVGAALETLQPFAVDVSSGVETGRGIKDQDKMARFVREVQRFDCRTR